MAKKGGCRLESRSALFPASFSCDGPCRRFALSVYSLANTDRGPTRGKAPRDTRMLGRTSFGRRAYILVEEGIYVNERSELRKQAAERYDESALGHRTVKSQFSGVKTSGFYSRASHLACMNLSFKSIIWR